MTPPRRIEDLDIDHDKSLPARDDLLSLEEQIKVLSVQQMASLIVNDLRTLPDDLRRLADVINELTRRFEGHQVTCSHRFDATGADINARLTQIQEALEAAVHEKVKALEAETKSTGDTLKKEFAPETFEGRVKGIMTPVARTAYAALLIGLFLLSMHYESISISKFAAFAWAGIRVYLGF